MNFGFYTNQKSVECCPVPKLESYLCLNCLNLCLFHCQPWPILCLLDPLVFALGHCKAHYVFSWSLQWIWVHWNWLFLDHLLFPGLIWWMSTESITMKATSSKTNSLLNTPETASATTRPTLAVWVAIFANRPKFMSCVAHNTFPLSKLHDISIYICQPHCQKNTDLCDFFSVLFSVYSVVWELGCLQNYPYVEFECW